MIYAISVPIISFKQKIIKGTGSGQYLLFFAKKQGLKEG
jgi:hypothetical protein